GAYTSSGAVTISIQGFNVAGGRVGAIHAVAGSHTISAPIALIDDTSISVPAQSTLTVSNLQTSSVTITKSGPGTLAANNMRASMLNIVGGAVSILPGRSNSRTSRLQSLGISPGAALNLNDQDLVLDYDIT